MTEGEREKKRRKTAIALLNQALQKPITNPALMAPIIGFIGVLIGG